MIRNMKFDHLALYKEGMFATGEAIKYIEPFLNRYQEVNIVPAYLLPPGGAFVLEDLGIVEYDYVFIHENKNPIKKSEVNESNVHFFKCNIYTESDKGAIKSGIYNIDATTPVCVITNKANIE